MFQSASDNEATKSYSGLGIETVLRFEPELYPEIIFLVEPFEPDKIIELESCLTFTGLVHEESPDLNPVLDFSSRSLILINHVGRNCRGAVAQLVERPSKVQLYQGFVSRERQVISL